MEFGRIAVALGFFASGIASAGEKYVCVEFDRATGDLKNSTVVLQQTGRGEIREGKPMGFSLEKFIGAEIVQDLGVQGTVLTEDVSFLFKSADQKVKFHIYLDEMDQSSLTVNGAARGDYICR